MNPRLPRTEPRTRRERLAHINPVALIAALGISAVIVILGGFATGLHSLMASNRVKARVLADNASARLLFQDAIAARSSVQGDIP